MNTPETKLSPAKRNQALEIKVADGKASKRIVMEELLKKWGQYVRLKTKVQKLFPEQQ